MHFCIARLINAFEEIHFLAFIVSEHTIYKVFVFLKKKISTLNTSTYSKTSDIMVHSNSKPLGCLFTSLQEWAEYKRLPDQFMYFNFFSKASLTSEFSESYF